MINRRDMLIGMGAATALSGRASAQGAPTLIANPASLAPPSNGSYMVAIIQDQGLDQKFGLSFKPTLYTDTGALYADFVAGKSNSLYAALYNGAHFSNRGGPAQLMFTSAASDHATVSRNPAIPE